MQLPLIDPPHFDPVPLTAAQRRGLAYQRRVGQWLRGPHGPGPDWDIHEGPWLFGPCQPDFVLTVSSAAEARGVEPKIVVLETKLTQCDCCWQLQKYRLALQHLAPVICVQVCRRVTSRPTVSSWDELADGTMLVYV
jgi:hypothetical protein